MKEIHKQFNTNYQLIEYLKQRNIIASNLVYYTLLSIDRKNFIPKQYFSYCDKASYIGYGAIISAPHMHAYALQYLLPKLRQSQHILDVGSGSGILVLAMSLLSPKSAKIYGIQHVKQLVQNSINNIKQQNQQILHKINIITGDGRLGWPDKSIKFDVIHVGAACQEIPKQLFNSLKQDGVMVIPIGKQRSQQKYMKIIKKNGEICEQFMQFVCYVPLTDLEYQKIR